MTPSRLINVLVGCGIGFGLLRLGGRSDWLIPFALAATVLISTYVSSAVFPKVTRYDRSRITTRGSRV